MRFIGSRLTYANVIATIALFAALGGGAYAATQLPKNSVGTAQIQNNAVTPAKLSAAAEKGMQGPAGPKGATGATGATGPAGATGPKGDTGATGAKGDAGATGLKGDTGDRGEKGNTGEIGPKGDTGPRGLEGPPGPAGSSGPLVIDAVATNYTIPDTTTAVQIPLTGTTTWTPDPGQVGLASAQMIGKVAKTGGGPIECQVTVSVQANGKPFGNTMQLFPNLTEPTVFQQTLSNAGAQAIGLLEPASTPLTITAVLSATAHSAPNEGCAPGTELEKLRVVVSAQG
jgi:hypothetical protein